MSTPTENGIVATELNLNGVTATTRAVLDGYRWGPAGDLDGTQLTYSFPSGSASFDAAYGSDEDASEWDYWYTLTTAQRSAVATALTSFTKFAALSFVPVADNATVVGDLRFAISREPDYAFAYTPYDDPAAGDVWFSYYDWNQDYYSSVPLGSYGYFTILHEIGHALGLKHPFEVSDGNAQLMPSQYDSIMHTIMSYDVTPGHPNTTADRYPTTPMYYDIVALEYLYGKSLTANVGNTTHVYLGTGKYWQTIVDSGGIDTIQYIDTLGGAIRLTPGSFCGLGQVIKYYNDPNPNGDWRTVWIGPSAWIENAIGSEGWDFIEGNSLANALTGNGGNDYLYGLSGADKLNGGPGNDSLYGGSGRDTLSGSTGNDIFVFDVKPTSGNVDKISGYNVAQDSIQLDNADFTLLTKLGKLGSSQYYERGNVDAITTGPGAKILYDLDSGNLYYDSNGAAAGGKLLIATLVGAPNLSNVEITVI
jgi:serralysin